MAQTFHWSPTRIAAYLQAEGDTISPAQVQEALERGYAQLADNLPADIRSIYLGDDAGAPPAEMQAGAIADSESMVSL